MTLAILREKREEILRVAASHGAVNVRIFGSLARGEAGPESDLDLLVEMAPGRSLLDRIGLLEDLQALLGCEVDVATERGLHWYIRERILNEAVPLGEMTASTFFISPNASSALRSMRAAGGLVALGRSWHRMV